MKRSRSMAEMTMEDLDFVGQDQMNGFGDFTSEEFAAAVFGEDYCSPSPLLTFNPSPLELEATPRAACVNQHYGAKSGMAKRAISIGPCIKPATCPQDHIIAERKRREKLSQQFIALTAIVPGLKKMDKTSVLGDTIKYLKELQERVKVLEEQTAKKTMESVVLVKKFHVASEDHSSSTNEHPTKSSNAALPEIEARVSGKNVLIRIHCEKQKGVMVKALAEIEKLHLSVLGSSIIPFGSLTLDVTVVAQMEDKFNIAVKDLVKNLRLAFHAM